MIKVGEKAPNFTTKAFHEGDFKDISLSDYDDQWKIVLFYPGDFTFV